MNKIDNIETNRMIKELVDMLRNPSSLFCEEGRRTFYKWKKNLDKETMRRFQIELGKMGYKFQFITLAGLHLNNYATFK